MKTKNGFWTVAVIKSNSAFLIKYNYEKFFSKLLTGRILEFFIPYIQCGTRKILILPNYLCFQATNDFDFIKWKQYETFIKNFFFSDEDKSLVKISDEEIENFKRKVELFKQKKEFTLIEENTFVRIKEGIFSGYFGVVKRIDKNKKRAIVLLENFRVQISVPLTYLDYV